MKHLPPPERYYHSDENFDFEKFYYNILGYTDPIFLGESVKMTMMFIYWDEQRKIPYAQYRVPKNLKEKEGFGDEAHFLEQYPLYLDDAYEQENKNFSIYQAFLKFKNLAFEKEHAENKAFSILKAHNLKAYFESLDRKIPAPSEHDANKDPVNAVGFKYNEAIMVNSLIQELNLDTSDYLPIPLVAMGELVGMVYYVFDRTKLRAKGEPDHPFNRRLLTLALTREYESIVLNSNFNYFDNKPEDPLKGYYHIFKELDIRYAPLAAHPEIESRNLFEAKSFLQDLGYDDYYRNILLQVLIKESDFLVRASKARVKSAIISIIMDSYAHNIGAHSLVALKWLFESRFKAFAEKFDVNQTITLKEVKITPSDLRAFMDHNASKFQAIMDQYVGLKREKKVSMLDVVRYMGKQLQKDLFRFEDGQGNLIAQGRMPISFAVYRFFEYLRDKSAFWSGVTRDTVFSGQVMSWPQLLFEFFNNTLFLGTIAHSEGINKVEVYVELPKTVEGKTTLETGGHFLTVDLSVIRKETQPKTEETNGHHQTDEEKRAHLSDYAFLRQGNEFFSIYEALKPERLGSAYLPNGIIGQHAFYTLLENTLRNIKHYKRTLATIRKTGIRLCLSIEPVGFVPRKKDSHEQTSDKKLFKVGAWLHHPQRLLNQEDSSMNEEDEPFLHSQSAVIHGHTQQLRRRVVDKEGQPILGGSAQDKVCASMLMNNTFLSIDEINLMQVKRHYFPYVFAASERFHESDARYKKDFAIQDECFHKIYNQDLADQSPTERKRKYKEMVRKYVRNNSLRTKGTIKKYFHLWRGETCRLIDHQAEEADGGMDIQNENLARFRLVMVEHFQKDSEESLPFEWKRELGVSSLKKKENVPAEQGRLQKPAYELIDGIKNTALYHLRNQGLIRIIPADGHLKANKEKPRQTDEAGQEVQDIHAYAMDQWLGRWLGRDREAAFGLVMHKPANRGVFEDSDVFEEFGAVELMRGTNEQGEEIWKSEYYHRIQLTVGGKRIKDIPTQLKLDHAEQGTVEKARKDCCRIRSHGSFMNELFTGYALDEDAEGNNLAKAELSHLQRAKLLETALTHISMFDNRLYERIQEAVGDRDKKLFQDQLNLEAYREDESRYFFDNLKNLLSKRRGHFMVVHLSYIETFYREKDNKKRYKESEVIEFFEQQIAGFYERKFGRPLPSNLILVVTSGRGRGDWFKAIEHPQITFRPIESLVNAIEDGLYLKDDFQIKYNLCNVLFGS